MAAEVHEDINFIRTDLRRQLRKTPCLYLPPYRAARAQGCRHPVLMRVPVIGINGKMLTIILRKKRCNELAHGVVAEIRRQIADAQPLMPPIRFRINWQLQSLQLFLVGCIKLAKRGRSEIRNCIGGKKRIAELHKLLLRSWLHLGCFPEGLHRQLAFSQLAQG